LIPNVNIATSARHARSLISLLPFHEQTVARRTSAFDPPIAVTVIEFDRKARIDREDVEDT
jgi:hypothetical protein